METPVRIQGDILEGLDAEAERLGLTRQRLTNVLLRVALSYLNKHGYELTLKLEAANEMVQASDDRA